jgi:hypothetical protein
LTEQYKESEYGGDEDVLTSPTNLSGGRTEVCRGEEQGGDRAASEEHEADLA